MHIHAVWVAFQHDEAQYVLMGIQNLKEKKRKRRAQWLEQADVDSRLSMCPPLSDVKNNSSSTRARTTSCRFDHQTHQSLLRHQVVVLLIYSAHCFEDPTHLVENTPI